MAFYVFPPKGTIPLEKLYRITTVRMRFLLAIRSCHGNSAKMRDLLGDLEIAEDSDILIEDSDKDRISHFCLRMTCPQDAQLRDFFVEAETMLFAYRLSCMQRDELLNAIKPLRKLLVKAETAKHKLSPPLAEVCHMIMYILHGRGWSRLIDSYFDDSDNEFINIPFQYVDELVGRRCVELRRGIATVPVSKLCDLLQMLFRRLLEFSVHKAQEEMQRHEKDRRMLSLYMTVKKLIRKSGLHGGQREFLGTITADQVDRLCTAFPPCMALLHKRLRSNHRLPHHARIRYTLFLKEAGLPLHEALQFWREEYSKESVSTGNHDNECSHSWQQDAKRYTYNIRHLYGLEGSRKNYRGHSCEAVQENCSTTETVGCPFKHFDSKNLQDFLGAEISPAKKESILKLSGDGDFTRCCSVFRTSHLEKTLKLPSTIGRHGKEIQVCEGKVISSVKPLQTQNSCQALEKHGGDIKVDMQISDINSYSPLCYVATVEKTAVCKMENFSVTSQKMLTEDTKKPLDCSENSDDDKMSVRSVDLFDGSFEEACASSDDDCDPEDGSSSESDYDANYDASCSKNDTCENHGRSRGAEDFSSPKNDCRNCSRNHALVEQLSKHAKRIKLEYESYKSCNEHPHIENDMTRCLQLCHCSDIANKPAKKLNLTETSAKCEGEYFGYGLASSRSVCCRKEQSHVLLEDENLQNRIFKPVDYYVGYRKMLERLKLMQ